MAVRALVLISLIGCNEYGIGLKTPVVPEVADTDVAIPPDIEDPPEPSCADAVAVLGEWRASLPFTESEDPVDSTGNPFWSDDFRDAELAPVVLPDVGSIPPGADRIYATTLDVDGSAPGWWMELQSDDGIAVWIDGQPVGAWGGRWQEEGCVNDDANCVEFVLLDPVDVGDFLTEGRHRVAIRVSNPVEGSYADVRMHCLD